MNKLKSTIFLLVAIMAVSGFIAFGLFNRALMQPPPETGIQKREWVRAHSLLLDIDYEYRPDTFAIIEGGDLDYKLSFISPGWGIFVSRIKGFAKSFVYAERPTAEFYRLIGDSDLYRWEKAHKLSVSEPAYSLYQKDGLDHLRQDFTIDVTAESRLPDYFPPDLAESVKQGKFTKISAGAFYYVSPDDIYIVHFITPFPVPDGIQTLLEEIVTRMTFGVGQSQRPAREHTEERTEPRSEEPAPPPAESPPPARSDSPGRGSGDVAPLPPNR